MVWYQRNFNLLRRLKATTNNLFSYNSFCVNVIVLADINRECTCVFSFFHIQYELRQRKEKKDRKSKGRKTSSMQLEAELLYYETMAKGMN